MPAARNSGPRGPFARRQRPPLEWALVSGYGDLLRTRGVARIIAAQLTARFPSGMLSLAYLLHIEGVFDSYGAAGLVLAATSVGQAVAGPLTSRWMGVWGMRPVIALTMAVCAASMATIAAYFLLVDPGFVRHR